MKKSGLIFEGNKISELFMKNSFIKASTYVSKSEFEFKEILVDVYELEPDVVVIDFGLYQHIIYDTINKIKEKFENCLVIVTMDKKYKSKYKFLFDEGADYVLIKPFSKEDVIKLLSVI